MYSHGYSLFECIIILALLSFIISLSSYFIGTTDTAIIRADLDRLYAVILFMQRKALLEGKACSIVFDLEKNQYVADRMYTLSSGVHFGVPAELLGPPSNPVTTISRPITWPENKITFYPDGSIKDAAISAGAVYLLTSRNRLRMPLLVMLRVCRICAAIVTKKMGFIE